MSRCWLTITQSCASNHFQRSWRGIKLDWATNPASLLRSVFSCGTTCSHWPSWQVLLIFFLVTRGAGMLPRPPVFCKGATNPTWCANSSWLVPAGAWSRWWKMYLRWGKWIHTSCKCFQTNLSMGRYQIYQKMECSQGVGVLLPTTISWIVPRQVGRGCYFWSKDGLCVICSYCWWEPGNTTNPNGNSFNPSATDENHNNNQQ